jgi:integrase
VAVKHLKAKLGGRSIVEITRADLKGAIDAIDPHKLATRRNFHAYTRILWKWAEDEELITSNPFEKLAAPQAPTSRDRVLTDDELRLFWQSSGKLGYPFGPVLRLLSVTGQRRSEVAGMDWSELDRDAATWTIPAARAKNGLAHIVPLSGLALAELNGSPQREIGPSGDWYSRPTANAPVSGLSRAKDRAHATMVGLVKKVEVEPPASWRIHDLRRTLATGLQRLGVRFEVTEAVLNHVSGQKAVLRASISATTGPTRSAPPSRRGRAISSNFSSLRIRTTSCRLARLRDRHEPIKASRARLEPKPRL